MILVVVVVVLLAGIVTYYVILLPRNQGGNLCSEVATQPVVHDVTAGNGSQATILIVEGDYPSPYAGINGSANQPANATWPIIHVHLGQTVSIHVINCASSEAHGFQVQHYDDRTIVAVPSGGTYDVTFTANQVGHFRVYCDILCAIHPLMQNGLFVVS